MNAITGYSEILLEEAEERDLQDFVSDVEKIRSEGIHLLELVDEVLELSENDSSTIDLDAFGVEVRLLGGRDRRR